MRGYHDAVVARRREAASHGCTLLLDAADRRVLALRTRGREVVMAALLVTVVGSVESWTLDGA